MLIHKVCTKYTMKSLLRVHARAIIPDLALVPAQTSWPRWVSTRTHTLLVGLASITPLHGSTRTDPRSGHWPTTVKTPAMRAKKSSFHEKISTHSYLLRGFVFRNRCLFLVSTERTPCERKKLLYNSFKMPVFGFHSSRPERALLL